MEHTAGGKGMPGQRAWSQTATRRFLTDKGPSDRETPRREAT